MKKGRNLQIIHKAPLFVMKYQHNFNLLRNMNKPFAWNQQHTQLSWQQEKTLNADSFFPKKKEDIVIVKSNNLNVTPCLRWPFRVYHLIYLIIYFKQCYRLYTWFNQMLRVVMEIQPGLKTSWKHHVPMDRALDTVK